MPENIRFSTGYAPYSSLIMCRLPHTLPVEKRVFDSQFVLGFFSKTLLQAFLLPKIVERNIIVNVFTSSCKVSNFFKF